MLKESDLRPAQQKLIDRLYENSSMLAVLGMGGGKTASALTAFAELQRDGFVRKGIVLAPPLVAATVWPREAAKWEHLRHLKVVNAAGTPSHRALILRGADADLFTISINLIPWLVGQFKLAMEAYADGARPERSELLDFLLIDEVSKLKGPRSSWGKELCEIAPMAKVKWGLTGTPRPNGFEDLFMPMRVLTDGKLWGTDFDGWRRRNFMQRDFNGYDWEVHDFRAKQLVKDLRPVMVKVPDADMPTTAGLNAGPEHNYYVDLPAEARKVYNTMEKHLIVEVRKNLHKDATDADVIVALSQAVASSKLEQAAQGYMYDEGEAAVQLHTVKVKMLQDMLASAEGENVAIVYKFKRDLEVLQKALGKDLVVLGGGGQDRAVRKMDDWNAGKIRYLALHPASAGHGVELQHGGHRMIWFCPTWSAEMYDQTIKRLDRPAQKLPVFSHQIVARDTVDEVKVNRVQHKMDDQSAFERLLRMV